MSSTFNSYVKQEPTVIGGHTPVWCGTVAPAPTGGVIVNLGPFSVGDKIPAGWPCHIDTTYNTVDILAPGDEQECNGYVYNDVYPARAEECTAAVVRAHGEGLLIDRVLGEEWNLDTLRASCPTVILTREANF